MFHINTANNEISSWRIGRLLKINLFSLNFLFIFWAFLKITFSFENQSVCDLKHNRKTILFELNWMSTSLKNGLGWKLKYSIQHYHEQSRVPNAKLTRSHKSSINILIRFKWIYQQVEGIVLSGRKSSIENLTLQE